MEKGWWKSGTVTECGKTIEQWNSVDSMVRQRNSVEQCGETV